MTEHENPHPAGTTGEGQENPETGTQPETGRTFTEAEVNAMVTARLSKQERSLRQQIEADVARRAEQSAEEQLAELREQLQARDTELQQVRQDAADRLALQGHVTDADYAIWLAGRAGDKYRTEDGGLNVQALLTDHPTLSPAPPTRPGPAPTTGVREQGAGVDMNSLILRAAGRK